MSHIIIDRASGNKNKSSINRDKFMRRASERVKKAVKDYIANDADIKSITGGSKKVIINSKTLKEPSIGYDRRNNPWNIVAPGNKQYDAGDEIGKPFDDGASGNEGSPDGEIGEDDFYFTLSHEEFLDLFFEDLELPDMVKKQLTMEKSFTIKPAGFTNTGPACRLDLRKTMMNSLKRSFSVVGEIENDMDVLTLKLDSTTLTEEEKDELRKEMDELINQKENIPFLQELDLRYRKVDIKPILFTKAVMICIMDVSGSMTEWHKEMAKRFFMILYLFLTKQYESVELVFIKHHHEAYEVDEDEFFHSTEYGGTVVSKALELTNKIINERYDISKYNLYCCEISDGDNYSSEDEYDTIFKLMSESLLPKLQYFAYVEVRESDEDFMNFIKNSAGFGEDDMESSLLKTYFNIHRSIPKHLAEKMNIRMINDTKNIYPIFRSLFNKK